MQSKDHLHFALISPASNTVSAHHDICQYSLFTVTKGTGGIAEWARAACLCLKFSAGLLAAMHLLPRIRPSVTVLILLCTQEDHHCLLVTRHTNLVPKEAHSLHRFPKPLLGPQQQLSGSSFQHLTRTAHTAQLMRTITQHRQGTAHSDALRCACLEAG